ncbi:MAG: dihydroorotase [Ignavibacteriae bacterium]|nr:dihydroorotase [Ignavibacteriota bacterium]
MSSYLFKKGHIIDPATGLDTVKDVLVVDGVIAAIRDAIDEEHAEVFDLDGMVLAPGFCDMHVHFREPGQEYKESLQTGALSAAAGGFTAVACMPNTVPTIDNAETALYIRTKTEHFPVEVLPIGAITKGREGKELAPMAELRAAGAVAFSDDGTCVNNTKLLRIALEYAGMFDLPVIQHAEDPYLFAGGVMHEGFVSTSIGLPGIPRLAEDVIVARDIAVAEYVDGVYHVAHVSSAGAVQAVRSAKERGLKVTCEVTPHHFTLTDEHVRGYNTNTKMNPPLRTRDDVIAMKEALRDGVIDAIATDHAPHAIFEKEVEYAHAPFGIVGLETAIGLSMTELVHTGYLTVFELIEKMSTNPRRILRLPDIRIEEGVPANFTFFHPEQEWTVDAAQFKSRSKNTPFHGMVLRGRPRGIFNRQQLVWIAE